MGFELDPSYKDVPTRIADFKEKHPEGSLRPVNPKEPYRIEAIDGLFFIVYMAAAYRSPDDKRPGIGIAWEPFPGKTPYTKNSELQNAETSAWGRAIVAVLASESKAVASAEDVRNRQADAQQPRQPELPEGHEWVTPAKNRVVAAAEGDTDMATKAWQAVNPEVTVIDPDHKHVSKLDVDLAVVEAERLLELAASEGHIPAKEAQRSIRDAVGDDTTLTVKAWQAAKLHGKSHVTSDELDRALAEADRLMEALDEGVDQAEAEDAAGEVAAQDQTREYSPDDPERPFAEGENEKPWRDPDSGVEF